MTKTKMKVIDFEKKREEDKPKGSDILQAGADMLSDMEDAGVQSEVVVLTFLQGSPVIVQSNVEILRLNALLDFAKGDVLAAVYNGDLADFEDEDDDTVH